MGSQINIAIIEYILNSEYEERMKSFLIEALYLEFDRQERESFRFTEDYRHLINRFYEG